MSWPAIYNLASLRSLPIFFSSSHHNELCPILACFPNLLWFGWKCRASCHMLIWSLRNFQKLMFFSHPAGPTNNIVFLLDRLLNHIGGDTIINYGLADRQSDDDEYSSDSWFRWEQKFSFVQVYLYQVYSRFSNVYFRIRFDLIETKFMDFLSLIK